DPVKEILDLKIGLRISEGQEAKLKVIQDSLGAQNQVLARELQAEMAKQGANVDGARMLTVIRPRLEKAQKHLQDALDAIKSVLTPEQWNSLPERVKAPRGLGPGGQRRAPPESE
ncbi:MAG: hypothetical protein HOP28_09380, partial [Gemmatimonadales bacterium]|nr:hypothetical protein [Gemmatimonadales bacterium]